MTSFQWSITPSRRALLNKLEEIPEFGKRSKSEILELALADFILKHGKSNNPQTKIEIFQDGLVKAIPNLYEEAKEFRKFYKLLNKEEYQRLDQQINILLKIHNENIK